jgi:subtilisin family serine protease
MLIEYKHLLELIGYPYHDETEIPDILKAPVSIGVFDTWVDTSHCGLGANIEPIEMAAGGAEREPAPHCGDMLPAPNVIDDHGTHVVGIIAAAPNDAGVFGLNPFAKVMFVQVDKNRLRVPDYREHLSDLLVQLYFGKEIKVVNMSWRYTNQTGEVDTIRQKIEGLRLNTLIVVAAGNDNIDFNAGGCGELPACLVGVDNIMTVVGLSDQGDGTSLWTADGEGSNTSAEFHIAAIAENVVSTVYGGYLGTMSGTSQAAPQVSAAASLLYAIHEKVHRVDEPILLPQRVKNRLMYTADLIPTLLDKVKSGRLNVKRALDVARTRLVLREDDGTENTYVGNLTQFGNDPNHELIICKTADTDNLEIARKDLRRLYYDSLRDRYIVFRNSRSGDRNSPLERITDCTLRTLSHEGEILTPNGPRTFKFWQIRDYVSPMFG